jgi:lysozyme
MPVEDIETKRLRAFIYMIECAETTPLDVETGRAFHVFYGNSTFQDLSNHPVLTGEKRGVPLSDAMCRNAGFGPGCVSTAAGAGQINLPTWRSVCGAGEWGAALPDFSPASQEEAIRRVLMLCGAYEYVLAGDFDTALSRASTRWASLTGSTAGQRPKRYETVLAYYQNGLNINNAGMA